MSTALPFRLLGESDLSAVRKVLQREAEAWSAVWFDAAPTPDFDVSDMADADTPSAGPWMIVGADPDAWVAWGLTGRPWRDFARLLLNAPVGPSASPSPLVESLLSECLLDLSARLFKAAGVGPQIHSPMEASLATVRTGYGAGSVVGQLGGDLPRQAFALGGAVVAGLVGERPRAAPDTAALVARESAVTTGMTRLEVVLGQAELSLAELANVSAGDVIRLQSPFREPLTVNASDGRPLLRAHLGTRGHHKAIQVIGKTS